MKKVLLDGEYIYLNDKKVLREETGIYIPSEENYKENTLELEVINTNNDLEDTLVNLCEDYNE